MRLLRPWLLAGAGLLGAGCQIPTNPPIVEQRWILPLEMITLDQGELLPAGVTVAGGGTAYDVTVDPASASASLGGLCGSACQIVDGQNVPTPPFQGSFQASDALPPDVVSVEVTSGSVDVTITNGFAFDPLVNGGSVTITVAGSGGPTLGTLVLRGASGDQLPPLASTTRTVTLGAGTVTGSLVATVEFDHAGTGFNVLIEVNETIEVQAVTTSILVSEATVVVDGLGAALSEEPLDSDLDSGLVDGILGGSVTLDVTNPFGVGFDGTITVGTVVKSVSITSAPTSTVDVTFSGQELRDILSDPAATFSGSGAIVGGPATVTPAGAIGIAPSIDLTVEIGG